MKHLLTSRFTQVLFYFSKESFVAFGTPLKIARNIPTKTRNIFHEISSQNITMRVNTFLRSSITLCTMERTKSDVTITTINGDSVSPSNPLKASLSMCVILL